MSQNRDFVEKRFNQPGMFRAPALYTAVVIAVAAAALAVYAFAAARDSVFVAALVPAVLFIGGVGALVQTYRQWRSNRSWIVWQAVGWFLLLLMLVALGFPGGAMSA